MSAIGCGTTLISDMHPSVTARHMDGTLLPFEVEAADLINQVELIRFDSLLKEIFFSCYTVLRTQHVELYTNLLK